MLSKATTPQQYLDELDDDWRAATLLELRELIREAAPELEEGIDYGMLGYRLGEQQVFNLNAQRAYVSLYVGDIRKIDPEGELLQGLDLGKGCIRFSKSKVVGETGVAEFIAETVRRARAGLDIDC